jgi:hypothetical protein
MGGEYWTSGAAGPVFLRQLQQMGFAVEGTERSAERGVPGSCGIPIHIGDLLEIDLAGRILRRYYDMACIRTCPRPDETLRKIRSLLKPMTVDHCRSNAAHDQAKRYGLHWFHHDPPRHLFGFGPESLTQLLNGNGFDIERISTHSLEQNPFGEIQSRLNAQGKPRDRLYDQLKGITNDSMSTRIGGLAAMALWAVPAVVRSSMESVRGRGASLIVIARTGKRVAG